MTTLPAPRRRFVLLRKGSVLPWIAFSALLQPALIAGAIAMGSQPVDWGEAAKSIWLAALFGLALTVFYAWNGRAVSGSDASALARECSAQPSRGSRSPRTRRTAGQIGSAPRALRSS